MERLKDWAELRAELVAKGATGAAQQLDRLLADGRRIHAIWLLEDHGVALVDPPRASERHE